MNPSEIYIGMAFASAFIAVLGCMLRFAWGDTHSQWKFKKEFGGGSITFIATDEEPYRSADPEGNNINTIP